MVKGKKDIQEYNGLKFDNKTELEFYQKLEKWKADGKIYDFEYECEYVFYPEWVDWRGKNVQRIAHYPDFKVWTDKDNYIIIDTKASGGFSHSEESVIKRKIFMFNHQDIPYYMISKMPKYLGGVWVETSKGYDFSSKVRNKYKKLFPDENTRKRDCKKFLPIEWQFHWKVGTVLGLFFTWEKTYTKKQTESLYKKYGDKIK